MYKKIDESGVYKNADLDGMLLAIKNQDTKKMISLMQNVFEEVASPESLELKQLMKEFGAQAAMLSGSGPAVFGFFADEQKADACCKKLCDCGVSAYLCGTTDSGIIIE
ncbi:MAG: hypothetical protein IKV36_02285 [Clostridia bacterium]|nr:hypothetical protein [Clostridia bacterium]